MLTFLELYQTLLGFVFFKLYADAGLVYPPPLDAKKDEAGAGVDAFSLEDATQKTVAEVPMAKAVEVGGKKVSGKDVRQTIKSIAADSSLSVADAPGQVMAEEGAPVTANEDFVLQPSKTDANQAASLPTLQTLSSLPQTTPSKLFASCTFWLSRETSRPIFEFIIRAFGGRIGWPPTSGSGSPFDETDASITHVIIDRPVVARANETEEERERRLGRKYVQPQWVVDCVNAGKILLEDSYAQGKTLPPHLSPFATYEGGAYDPTAGAEDVAMQDAESEVEDEEEPAASDGEADEEREEAARPDKKALAAAAAAASEDPAGLRAAELAAEAAGVDFGTFEKEVAKSRRKAEKAAAPATEDAEVNMNKMLMSNKQRKLYERMKYSQKKKATEVSRPFMNMWE